MRCPECGGPVSPNDYECPLCGAELQRTPTAYRTQQQQPVFQHRPPEPAPQQPVQQPPPPEQSMWDTASVPVYRGEPRRTTWLPLAAVGVGLVVVLVAAFLFFRSGDPRTPVADPGPTVVADQGPTDDTVTDTGPTDSTDGSGTDDTTTDPGPTTDLTGDATVNASSTSQPNVDGNQNRVFYDASNMNDGSSETAWRTDGDGSGVQITIDLGGVHTITQVGLINGYAKTDPNDGTNRYTEERRIRQVTWTIGDQTITQPLADGTESLQNTTVPDVQASQITLTIDATTAPGDRDYTAISELQVVGA